MANAFIGLGGNLQDPQAQVARALRDLDRLPSSRVIRRSSLYRSAPVGYADQPDFVNAVAELETTLAPRALLAELLAIEKRYGRIREFQNSPRTLDLDLLLYGDLVLREAGLTLPHPRMHERSFVLVPLREIAPDATIPGVGAVKSLPACDPRCLNRLVS